MSLSQNVNFSSDGADLELEFRHKKTLQEENPTTLSAEFPRKTEIFFQVLNEFRRIGFLSIAYKITVSEPQLVADDEDFSVFKIYVRMSNDYDNNISSLVNKLLASMVNWCKTVKEKKGITFRPTVVVPNKKLLKTDILSGADLYLACDGLCFGNLSDHDLFIPHFHLDMSPNNGFFGARSTLEKFYEVEPRAVVRSSLMADFEHDRRKLFIRFPVVYREKDNSSCEAVIKLELRYNTIRRIFINFEDRDTSTGQLTFYFHLDVVPLVFRMPFSRFNGEGRCIPLDKKRRFNQLGDRRKHWINGSMGDIKQDLALFVESQYMQLTLNAFEAHNFMSVLNRLHACTGKPLLLRPFRKFVVKGMFRGHNVNRQLDFPHPIYDEYFLCTINNDFAVLYMIEALKSRGHHFKDQLLLDKERIHDLKTQLVEVYKRENGRKLLIDALENLLAMVDEALELDSVPKVFKKALRKAEQGFRINAEVDLKNAAQGYCRVRKIIITPSRCVYYAPEMIMGNRILRNDKYFETVQKNRLAPGESAADRFIRVQFRDENFTQVLGNVGSTFIKMFVEYSLMTHMTVGGRRFNYFGSSNSQMREQGCYFMNGNDDEMVNFRDSLGRFSLSSVPKLMARLGQCFTQSCRVGNEGIRLNRCGRVPDYICGVNKKNELYTFSDGNGCMSYEFARGIATSMNFEDFVPCCVQSRFRGYKGINVVNPYIDRLNAFAKAIAKKEDEREEEIDLKTIAITSSRRKKKRRRDGYDEFVDWQLWFRPSQEKFITARHEKHFFEVVKVAAPSSVCLNRPMINILDQVSAIQSYACHKRVSNRCFQLLDLQLNVIAESLTDERAARAKLAEFPSYIMLDVLSNLNLTTEPFFRALLRNSARCTLKKLREKMQIQIPQNLGRSMLGVVDESGQLQWGQVFVRYTVNVQNKRPGFGANRRTHTGAVMITKNPMVVAGDVRMFEAVDVPSLHHLCDVVVFPRYGPRPHPDEMAGSDLDGDEYSVIWDPGLFFMRSEEPFDYIASSCEPIAGDEDNLRKQMATFFCDYISQDSIGKISNAFLSKSDMYNINTKVCHSIALKIMEAVDFPKTGKAPSKLCKGDEKRGIEEEIVHRYPDFMEKSQESTYESPRLNGRLFRRIKNVDHILEVNLDEKVKIKAPVDQTFNIDGVTKRYMDIAKEHFLKYQAALEHQLLQRFGIDSEVELFSNSFSAIRRRISDKEMDDMSFFNTQRVIEETLEHIFSLHRRMFFEAFREEDEGKRTAENFLEQSKSKKEVSKTRRIIRERCTEVLDDHKKLAVAYYRTAYGHPNRRFLSFAWLCADVLVKVRQQRLMHMREQDPNAFVKCFSHDPISDKITEHIRDYCSWKAKRFDEFCSKFDHTPKNRRLAKAYTVINRYIKAYHGLDQWMYFMVKWAEEAGVLAKHSCEIEKEDQAYVGIFDKVHICLVILLYGTGRLDGVRTAQMFEMPDKLHQMQGRASLHDQLGGVGSKFLSLMRFLASRDFLIQENITFTDFGLIAGFFNGEWYAVQKRAERTYYNICLTDELTTLPHVRSTDDVSGPQKESRSTDVRVANDGVSFLVEVMRNDNRLLDHGVQNILCNESDVTKIMCRPDACNPDDSPNDRLIVTCLGTAKSCTKLRKLLTPKCYLNVPINGREMAESLAAQIQRRITEIQDKNKSDNELGEYPPYTQH